MDTKLILQQIYSHKLSVGVIGLGYVGLPLACLFAKAGFNTTGFDIDASKINAIYEGHSYLSTIQSDYIASSVKEGKLEATTNFVFLSYCDAIIICVPTPLTKSREPDMSFIVDTVNTIQPYLRKGQIIVLESTTYPGTTDEVILPILQKSGLVLGQDFFLGFSPEREDPGNIKFNTKTIPKIVSGLTPICKQLITALYEQVIDKVIPVSSTRAAELTKLVENTYRCVNIALVNELKLLCHRMDIDIHEVLDAAATKPFGFHKFTPGPGLGGHCLMPGTMVMMGDGSERAIEEIQVGDYVITGKGKRRKVLKTIMHPYQGLCNILYIKSTPFTLGTTCDHEVLASVWKFNNHKKNREFGITQMIPTSQLRSWHKNKWIHRLHQHAHCIGDNGNIDLARLLGLYLAEGFTDGRKGQASKRVQLAFHEDEKDLQDEVKILFKKCFGCETTIHKPHSGKCLVIRASNKYATTELIRLGNKLSWEKKLAPEVFSWSKECLEALWDGWVDGDGYYREDGGVTIVTVSPQLARDMYRVGLMLNKSIALSIHYISGKRPAYFLRTVSHNYCQDGHRTVAISNIEQSNYNGLVYDLEIDEDHSFIANTLIVSNCIPLDPFYLTWKARQYDFQTKFIELAGEINTNMPRYIVQRVAEKLNSQQKSLSGSSILLLGIAYKKDINDVRESPALKIIEFLLEQGANISYHDPFLPMVPKTRHYSSDMQSVPLDIAHIEAADCVLIVTDHTPVDYDLVLKHAKAIVDSRNVMNGKLDPESKIFPA